MKLSWHNVRKRFFPTKKHLKGSSVSITESLASKCMEILKKAWIEHGFTKVWTSDEKILYKCSRENKVKLYYK